MWHSLTGHYHFVLPPTPSFDVDFDILRRWGKELEWDTEKPRRRSNDGRETLCNTKKKGDGLTSYPLEEEEEKSKNEPST